MKLFHALALLFCTTCFYGLLGRSGVPSFVLKCAIEVSLLCVVLSIALARSTPKPPGIGLLSGYVVLTFVSCVVATETAYDGFLYCRFVLYAYAVLCAVWFTPMAPQEVKRINILLLVLFSLQVLATVHKVFILHGNWEGIVGTVSASGGELATTLPIFAMGYGLAIYLCYRQRLWILAVTFSFMFVGYASGKRGIWFLMPVTLFLEYLIYLQQQNTGRLSSITKQAPAIVIMAVVVTLAGIDRIESLRSDEANTVTEKFRYAWNYGVQYETRTPGGETTGRTSTSNRVLAAISSTDFVHLLLGWGPRALMGTGGKFDELQITYGITGWTRDVISVGWPAMLLYVLLYMSLARHLIVSSKQQKEPYWRMITLGTQGAYILFFVSHFLYGPSFSCWGTLSFPLAYFTAILLSPTHAHLRQSDPHAIRSPSRRRLRFRQRVPQLGD